MLYVLGCNPVHFGKGRQLRDIFHFFRYFFHLFALIASLGFYDTTVDV